MVKHKPWSAAATVAILGWSTMGHALQPASLGTGSVRITPTLGVSYVDDDNVRAERTPESGAATVLGPRIGIQFGQGNATGTIDYSLTRRVYNSFSGEDTTDQALGGSTSLRFDVRNALDLAANWSETESNGAAGAPLDQFTNTGFSSLYQFGTNEALLNLDLGWKVDRQRSDNTINLDKERDVITLNGVTYVRVSPRTQGLFEVRHTDASYETASLKDNERLAYLVGARWEATAFTSGSARIGYEEQSFDQPGKADETSTIWELGVTWQPRSYSQFNLNASQKLEDGDDGARSSEQTRYGLTWDHDWAGPLATRLSVARIDDDYDNNRSDERLELAGRVAFEVNRRMDIGIRYAYTDKTSTTRSEDYDRERVGLFVDLGL